MIQIHCKKSFKGNIDIRSTYIDVAKRTNSPIQVTCDELEGVSIYQPEELDNPVRIQTAANGKPFKTKMPNSTVSEYTLYVFKWKGEIS
jgi:hypothetical protein